MQLSTSVLLSLTAAWSCFAAPAVDQARDAADALITLPASCTKPHSCYTHTMTTAPPTCPECVRPTGLMCPMIIKIETLQVPCSNACCPATPTQIVTKPCASCPTGCVIPTQTIIETTGCSTTGPVITPDPTAHVTLWPGKA